jgi:hypothetical protein
MNAKKFMKIKNLYIFGDSFSTPSYEKYAWIQLLSAKYNVINFSKAGNDNHSIFLDVLNNIKKLTNNDFLLIVWSDYTRFFSHDKNSKKLQKIYYKSFFNNQLLRMQSLLYMRNIKEIIEERNLQHLICWSFPTRIDNIDLWTNSKDFDNDSDNLFKYDISFKNEIRPALFYFSRKELANVDVLKVYSNDIRPNHIKSKDVHLLLYKTVNKYIENKLNGQVNLKELSVE